MSKTAGAAEQLRRHGWWFTLSIVAGVVVGLAFDLGGAALGIWLGYVASNSAGVWLYCDHLEDRAPRRQLVIQLLAVAMVPAGLIAVFAVPVEMPEREPKSAAHSDEPTRPSSIWAERTSSRHQHPRD